MMKSINNITYLLFIAAVCMSATACTKSEFLDAKPTQNLIVPETLEDLQGILDYNLVMNGGTSGQAGLDPQFSLSASDDFFSPANLLSIAPVSFQNQYVWSDDIYGNAFTDWNQCYQSIFYANTAMDGLAKLHSVTSQDAYNNVKGSALFYRSRMFYVLSQVFAVPYDAATAASDWGVVLRLSSDIGETIKRATVKQTYDRMIADIKESATLLPDVPLLKTRPSKPAAYLLLAKVYLDMHQYDSAFKYVNACLQIKNDLLDYNSLPVTSLPKPELFFNKEVILHCITNSNILLPKLGRADTTLYKSFNTSDLRRTVFYRFSTSTGLATYQGSYDGTSSYFSGLATDEAYITRAECYARLGDKTNAMKDLNDLLRKRFVTNSYTDMQATDASDALQKVLIERRKELVMRNTRWTDLRRLNKEGANISITRILNNQTYTLLPNDKRYTFLIPPDIIGFHPDMPQNPR